MNRFPMKESCSDFAQCTVMINGRRIFIKSSLVHEVHTRCIVLFCGKVQWWKWGESSRNCDLEYCARPLSEVVLKSLCSVLWLYKNVTHACPVIAFRLSNLDTVANGPVLLSVQCKPLCSSQCSGFYFVLFWKNFYAIRYFSVVGFVLRRNWLFVCPLIKRQSRQIV